MNFFKMVLAVLVAQVLIGFALFFGLGLMTALFSSGETMDVADGSWLVIDLYGDIPPYDAPESISNSLFDEPETLQSILDNLEKADADDRVAGVVMKISSSNSLGMASLGEIRTAIARIREGGKPVVAFSDDLDRDALYLASACDSIFMPNVADVTFTGYGSVESFYKGTLDKLDVHENLHKIKDYKTAVEPFQRDSMSPESREMTEWLIQEIWEVELGAIARDRGIPMDSLVACMEHALFTPQEAKRAQLIDDVVYWDELEERLGGEDELLTITTDEYDDVRRADVGLKGKNRIAVVHAYGFIGGRESHTDPTLGVMMGHETVIDNLRSAADDGRVDAIVFRVDSPGGESLASELIAREVGKIAADKPVIVSMGDVAASGGYLIAMTGDPVIAERTTLTGSIGIIYGKLNLKGLYDKLGIHKEIISRGKFANLDSDYGPYTPEERNRVQALMEDFYGKFINKVAAARKMTPEDVDKVAQGRVWTGEQALEHGLVDELGGLERSLEILKEKVGLPLDASVELVEFPRHKSLMELIIERIQGNETGMPAAVSRWLLEGKFWEKLSINPYWARIPYAVEFH